jgi:hypothetical protein
MTDVTASTFADPADIAAYKSAITAGESVKAALYVGDNGIGYWGDDTTSLDNPICALPRDDWETKWGPGKEARGKCVNVTYRGKTVVAKLLDTMPVHKKIKNGAGIDLNPCLCKTFSIAPGDLYPGFQWEWFDK